jgi:tRNA threonylcarbamoyladenosine modification (KEOPS) complex  Pcc1 subunit
MTLTCRAELTIRTRNAAAVQGALSPEMSERVPRTCVEVVGGDGEVTIRVEAEDLASLRAALNSYIRWADVAQETAEEASR